MLLFPFMRLFVTVRFLVMGDIIALEILLLVFAAVEIVFVLRSLHRWIGLLRLWLLSGCIRFHSLYV